MRAWGKQRHWLMIQYFCCVLDFSALSGVQTGSVALSCIALKLPARCLQIRIWVPQWPSNVFISRSYIDQWDFAGLHEGDLSSLYPRIQGSVLFNTLNINWPWSRQQYLLQDINAEQPRPGDDAALSCAVSSKDEIGWSEQLGLSQPTFSFLVAGDGKNTK